MLAVAGRSTSTSDRAPVRVRVDPRDGTIGRHEYAIEPDASAACYFWAAAAITGGRVTVAGLNRKSLQGDVRFVDVLEQMGCRVEECDAGITVHGGTLRGVDVDMNDISDTVMTLGAVACFADGPTTIRNVAHIRHKETDRIAALATELRKLGAEVEERADGLTITPRPLHGLRGGHVQRPPHGDEPGAGRAEGAGRGDPQSRVRREDVSGVLAGFGEAARLSASGRVNTGR